MAKSFDAAEGMIEIDFHRSLEQHLFSLFDFYVTISISFYAQFRDRMSLVLVNFLLTPMAFR